VLLVLFRHGIAIARDDKDCPADAERALTGKGRRRTIGAAEGLAAMGVKPDRVLSSPYRRARESAEIVAEVLGVTKGRSHVVEGLLPDDPPRRLGKLLIEHRGDCVLVVGHAPHLDRALRWQVDGDVRVVTELKKAGAAGLDVTKPGDPGGTLLWMATPGMLRALGGDTED
jgi:phosphohistidine phosphatase